MRIEIELSITVNKIRFLPGAIISSEKQIEELDILW